MLIGDKNALVSNLSFLLQPKENNVKGKGRYTFLYVKENGLWKIQHHHSSVMPEEFAMGKAITEEEVQGLFGLWNDALATKDPKKVAMRYAKHSVLLPTVR